MEYRSLGQTGLKLSSLSFGASSLGAEFRPVDINEALKAVPAALDVGMNFIDTSPFYGRGMSEVLLGTALRGIPRDRYILGSKLGRYDKAHFDFSAKRVIESVDVSLHRMGVEYLDICLCHDIEFVDMQQIIDETLPALLKVQHQGKVRFIGVSGYPMKMFKFILDQTNLDVVFSNCRKYLDAPNAVFMFHSGFVQGITNFSGTAPHAEMGGYGTGPTDRGIRFYYDWVRDNVGKWEYPNHVPSSDFSINP